MRTTTAVMAGVAMAATAAAENWLGFNSGATKDDMSAKFKADFQAEFETAQGLKGAPGDFNSVRLYTNIQAYSETDPIEAFEAAIDTKTNILLGVWCSGVDNINNEITALQKAVDTYGKKLTDLIIGVSIGSEDLYRNSATGVANDAGIGADPDVIVGFIQDFRDAFEGTAIAKVPLGHVDTWDVWPNTTNSAVIDAIDWLGVDEYPYYENGKGNSIENSGTLFDTAFNITKDAAGGKPVWVTETGWPTTGPDWDEAVASVENAKYFWDEIGCRQLFGQVPTFWYTLRDSNPDNTMKFAITKNLSKTPLFDLTCPTEFDTPMGDSTSTAANPDKTDAPEEDGEGSSTSASAPEPTGEPGSGSGSDSPEEADTTGSADGASQTGGDGEGAASTLQIAAGAYVVLAAVAGLALL